MNGTNLVKNSNSGRPRGGARVFELEVLYTEVSDPSILITKR